MRHAPPVRVPLIARRFTEAPRTASAARQDPRIPAAPLSSVPGCACGGGCPQCQAAGTGQALPDAVRSQSSLRFAHDLSAVRVHTGPEAAAAAQAMNARAFTFGTDIFFDRGRYAPDTASGRRLLAHELAHVVQQSRGRPSGRPAAGLSTSSRHETEARAVAAGETPRLSPHPAAIQRDGNTGAAPAGGSTPPSNYQLQLDPALMAQVRLFLAQWLASQAGSSSVTAPLTGLSPAATGSGASPSFSLTPPYRLSPSLLTPAPSFTRPTGQTLPPAALAPTPPDPTFVPPDYSSIYGPYNDRSVPLDGRDRDAPILDQLYRQRWQLVSGLPDLRSMAPSAIRHLIPNTWRRDLASALTGLTAGSQLKHDYPTAIEAADTMFMNMTGNSGAVPTYINPPIPPFKWTF